MEVGGSCHGSCLVSMEKKFHGNVHGSMSNFHGSKFAFKLLSFYFHFASMEAGFPSVEVGFTSVEVEFTSMEATWKLVEASTEVDSKKPIVWQIGFASIEIGDTILMLLLFASPVADCIHQARGYKAEDSDASEEAKRDRRQRVAMRAEATVLEDRRKKVNILTWRCWKVSATGINRES